MTSLSGSARDLVRRAAWSARSAALVDRSADERDAVVLIGSPRSGTTWLAEVIDRHHDHRQIFEPLRPGTVPELEVFGDNRYLRPGESDGRYVHAMSLLLRGRIRHPWSDHLNRVWVARRRLVKEIRANLLAAWLVRHFPGVPVVMIVRHPLAVVASRRSMGWRDQLAPLLAQDELVADHLEPVVDRLRAMEDPVGRALAQWAVETVVPLRMTTPDELCVVSYEQLVTDPRPALGRVLRTVGQTPDRALEAALERPSRLARADSAVSTGADRLASHRRHLLDGEEQRAAEVLGWFGLDRVFPPGADRADVDALDAVHRTAFPPDRDG